MAVHGPSKSWIDDTSVWEALFTAFLTRRIRIDDLKVTVSETQISVSTSNPLAELALREIFQDSKSTRDSLQVTLSEVIGEASLRKEVPLQSPVIDFRNLSAQGVLPKIFSEDLLLICGLSPKAIQEFDNQSSQTLRIPIPSAHGFDTMWSGRLKILSAAIIRAGLTGLYNAYLNLDKPIEINPSEQAASELGPTFRDKLRIHKEGATSFFELHYGALLKLLFPQPPTIRCQKTDTLFKISFNREELIAFLSRTFAEGFMLNPQADNASLICFPAGSLAKTKNLFSLLLDCSGSMQSVFSDYISCTENLAFKIIETSSEGDIIRVVAFSTVAKIVEFILTGDIASDKDKISAHFRVLKKQGANDGTRLYDTTLEELQASTNYPGFVQTVVAITDGQNNVGDYKDDSFLTEFKMQTTKPSQSVPKVFTMGLGLNYNSEIFTKWSQGTGVPHIHLDLTQGMKGFDEIFGHVEKMRRPRKLATVAQGLAKSLVSIYEGTIAAMPNMSLAPNEPFSFGDRAFLYRPSPAPTATLSAAAAAAASSFTPSFDASRQQNAPAEENQEGKALSSKFWDFCRIS